MTASVTAAAILLLALSWGVGIGAEPPKNESESRGEFLAQVGIAQRYFVVRSNITYRTANDASLKLDVYKPNGIRGERPTLVYFHGGGWMENYTKDSFPLVFAPFLGLNWVVINIDYRPSSVSLAPAAVEDCLCAMRWIVRHASEYNIDAARLVTMGNSAGGHLALTTGLIPLSDSGFGGPCTREDAEDPETMRSARVAAIINWNGITDVADLIEGKNRKEYAVIWIGNQPDRLELARSVSPLSYIRTSSPPVISIHGDRDPGVPYRHAVRLHAELTKSGVFNKLVTIRGGGHGFDLKDTTYAYEMIFEFLRDLRLIELSDDGTE